MSFFNEKAEGFPLGSVSRDELQLNEILSGLKQKQSNLNKEISKKENEKEGLISDVNILTKRLKDLRKSISKKKTISSQYEQNLQTFEKGLFKINESTSMLLELVISKNEQLEKESNL